MNKTQYRKFMASLANKFSIYALAEAERGRTKSAVEYYKLAANAANKSLSTSK